MEFSIKSNASDRELVFSNLKGDYFQVAIRGFKVSANTTVYAYTDAKGLNNIFQELGKLNQAWNGEKKWESIEGDFSLIITCNKLGHVLLEVSLRILQGHPEEVSVRANIATDFGLLSNIARDAKDFFEQN
jgi:hypothetical protein